MKAIINVSVKMSKVKLDQCKADLLVLGRFSDTSAGDADWKLIDKRLDGALTKLGQLKDFSGKQGQAVVLYCDGKIGADRVMAIGLGEKKNATADTARKAAAMAANKAVDMKLSRVAIGLHKALKAVAGYSVIGEAIAEGVYFGSYRYDEFVTGEEDGRSSKLRADIVEPEAKAAAELRNGVNRGAIVGAAQSYARTVANRPGNVINPVTLAAEAQKMARSVKGLTCTVYNEAQLKQRKMGGILAVGKGSKTPPRLIVLRYNPPGKAAGNTPVVGLVGKAITFDSGGISIKPSANMGQMKLDKSGGIAVLATMRALAELGLGIKVYGIIPSAENMPSGSSCRPGDIVTTYSGKTVEILNTDAEGRMVLCDGLAYGVKQKCDVLVDVATLTGACLVALGKYKAGLMSNDDKLTERLKLAADQSGEPVWHMPSDDEYAEDMKSQIADLQNIGKSKWGGACTAAAFLRQFVDDKQWAHLDIAGMDLFEKKSKHSAEGSRGFGVRLLSRFLTNIVEENK